MRRYYKFQEKPEQIEHILTEIEDNLVPYDSEGNIVIDKDIRCRSLYLEGDSLYINGIKIKSPKFNDDNSILQYNRKTKIVEFKDRGSAVFVSASEPSDPQINDVWIKI